MSNWIHIDDQKPEELQNVFYFFEVLGVYKGHYGIYIWDAEEHGLDQDAYSDVFYGKKGFLTDDVTHWMPAPPDDEWDGEYPDIPEDYIELVTDHMPYYAHVDNVMMITKDEYESLKDLVKYYEQGHLKGLVCQEGCPCHIYWNEEDDGYSCGCCGVVYPTEEVENNPDNYRETSYRMNDNG